MASVHNERMGIPPRVWQGRVAALLLPLALGLAGCGGADSPEVAAPPPTTLAPCSTDRHVVVFDYFGTISMDDDDLLDWIAAPASPPPARPGVADVAAAYRSRGYEVLYITTAPTFLEIGERPVGDRIAEWLTDAGFPMGEGVVMWVWDGNETPMRGISAELERLVGEGASVDAAYTDNEDKAFAFKSAVPSERVFTLGTGASTTGTSPVPGDDMVAHVAEVELLDQVCQTG